MIQHSFRASKGFTIVELIIVIAVIGILAAIGIVAYNGVTQNTRDKSVLSDLDGVAAEIARYSVKNNGMYGSAIAWYSPSGSNTNIKFIPSEGNVIDVVANDTGYCVRGYNRAGTKNSLINAYTKEAPQGTCAILPASSQAQNDNDAIAGAGFTWKKLANSSESRFTCAISTSDKAYCWGYNYFGQLGDNSVINRAVPIAVNTTGVLSGKTILSMSVGSVHACAIANDNNAYCWGRNTSGELGNNSTTSSSVPVAVTTSGALSGKTVKDINVGANFSCAIASDNQAYCWGDNSYGQLGNNSTTSSSVPVAVTTSGALSGKTVKAITSAAGGSVCAIASDNLAYCWGDNLYGQLGNNSTTSSSVPVAVTTSGALSGKTVKAIDIDYGSVCVIASDNQAYCWGENSNGQLGNNTMDESWVPVAVDTSGVLSGKTVTSLSTGVGHTCIIASDNKAYCFGGNFGRLGNNATTQSSVPVAVDVSGVLAGLNVASITASEVHTCVIASDNALYCWGSNYYGELGNNGPTGNFTGDSLVPVKISIPPAP